MTATGTRGIGSWLSDLPLLVVREMSMADDSDTDSNSTSRWDVGAGPTVGAGGSNQYRWVSIVDEVILASTILGASAILGCMFFLEYRGRPATTRMRLVQSLVLSDLILGIIGIIGTSLVLSGNPLQDGTSTCNGLGFCLTAVLWTEHLWTLLLAVATYLILIYPLHPLTLWLERRWYWLWLLVWVFATAIGIIGYTLFGFQPSGGICYYGPNSGLYGELIQFLPRATVMLCITILYARLFVFLRRPDRIRASFSDSSNADLYDSDRTNNRRSRFRPKAISNLLRIRKGSKETQSSDKGPLNEKGVRIELPPKPAQAGFDGYAGPADQVSPGSGTATPRPFRGNTPPPTPDEPAPWEQIQLPIFHVDGERFGGREVGSERLHRENSSIWSGWKGLGKSDKGTSRGHRPSTAGSTSPNMASTSRIGSVSTTREVPASPRSVAAATFPPTLEVDTPILDSRAEMTPTQARYNAGDIWQHPQERHGSIASSLGGRVDQLRKQSAISYTVAEEPYTLSSTPSSTSIPIVHDGNSTSRRPSAPISENAGQGATPRQNTTSRIPAQEDNEEEEEEGDNDWDLMQMLQASAPANGTRSQQEGEERIEFVEESMASYLNRKTALLMLWFPLGYVLLFSVSLIRIIYDFVGTPPIGLRAVARWFVFSQGVLDALIYGLVEWHTKRVIRKRVRKGTFNTPAGSRSGGDRAGGGGTGSALGAMRAFGQGSKNLISSRLGSVSVGGGGAGAGTKSTTGQKPSTFEIGTNNQQTLSRTGGRTPTTSFIPVIPENGYTMSEPKEVASSDELDLESTRKGSTVGSGSEVGLGPVVEVTMSSDGRARERRKEG